MADEEGEGQQAGAQEAVVETPAVPAEVETKARDMGWVPKEQYRGDPERWKPADEFVRRGEEVLPIVNAENRRLKERLNRVETESAEKIANLERMNGIALKAQRSQIESQYESLKEKAVELGDTKQYRAADKAQKDALKEFDAAATEPAKENGKGKTKTGLPADEEAVLDDWLKTNESWYKSPKLQGAADEAWVDVMREMPGAPLADTLAEIKARVAEEFPTAFGRKTNGGGSRVEGAGGRGPSGNEGGGEAWGKLPAEAKQQAERFIKEGIFDPPGKKKGEALTPAQLKAAREAYAEQYFS